MNLVELPLVSIKPYWRNPRHNAEAVPGVKQSIQDYGYNQPIVVDLEHVIVVGHTRYRALLELGWTVAKVVVADLPPEKAKEYRLIDNKSHELATWNLELLIPELREVGNLDRLKVFFPKIDLDGMLKLSATVQPVTQLQVDAKQQQMDTQFTQHSAQVQAQYVAVVCPHCTAEFAVDRVELSKQPAMPTPGSAKPSS